MCCPAGTAAGPPSTTTPTWATRGNVINTQLNRYSLNRLLYVTSPVFCCSSYVRFDILQRILSRMFGVTVIHAMVITDIDDKIIRRGWEVRLMISD